MDKAMLDYFEKIRLKILRLYATDNEEDPMVWVKFFTPDSSWTWYVTEFDGDDTFFGLVDGQAKELGYFLFSELKAARGPRGLPIEIDLYFKPCPLSKAQD